MTKNGEDDPNMRAKLNKHQGEVSKSLKIKFDRTIKILIREVRKETLAQLAHNLEVQFSKLD